MKWTFTIPATVLALGTTLAIAGPSTDLRVATDLPLRAHQLREDGVPNAEVEEAVTAAEDAGLPAAETAEVLAAEVEAEQKHGRIDNFGSFVKSQLKEGKRGKELAAAIHAEHQERGMGKSNGKGKGKDKPEHAGKGKPEHAGKGKPDHAGNGKPDHAGKGKPDHAGKGQNKGGGKPDHAGNGKHDSKGKGKKR